MKSSSEGRWCIDLAQKCDIWQLGGRDEGGGLYSHPQNPNITEGRKFLSRDRKSYLIIL